MNEYIGRQMRSDGPGEIQAPATLSSTRHCHVMTFKKWLNRMHLLLFFFLLYLFSIFFTILCLVRLSCFIIKVPSSFLMVKKQKRVTLQLHQHLHNTRCDRGDGWKKLCPTIWRLLVIVLASE